MTNDLLIAAAAAARILENPSGMISKRTQLFRKCPRALTVFGNTRFGYD
jgi:hypothetical protein